MKGIKALIYQFKDYKKLLDNSKFMRLILAGFVSSMGNKISYFALLIKVYKLSGGKIQNLGFLAITEMLPYMIFGTLAGMVVDKISRKKIMIISDVLRAFVVVSIIFVKDMNFIYVTAFLSSFMGVFREPAQRALEPNLVDKEDIPLMNSFGAAASDLIQIIGSAVGAAVVGFLGVNTSFIINGITFLISAIIISTISIRELHIDKAAESAGSEAVGKGSRFKREFKEGISIILKDKSLKLMTMISLYMTFAISMQGTLIFVFLIENFGMTEAQASKFWGILLSSIGVGALLGSMILGIVVKRTKNRFRLLLNILVFDSMSLTLFILNRFLPLSVVIFAFLGCIGTADNIILNTFIQDTVKDENRGKVFGMLGTLSSPISILSIFVGTYAAGLITAKNVLLIAAGLELMIALGVRFTKGYKEYKGMIVEEQSEVEIA